ncbi:hypothetical protein BZA70DRAFT_160020 [Myxozyma melibiosi]|uniref:Uncharacterized protein n=1 Tax=Myxozyma melibiosi TaxID=54550 RepID=A0ABR1F6N6_9ASCO
MGSTPAILGMDVDDTNFSIAPIDIANADIPKSIQRQLDDRLEKIQREIKAYQEFKAREFESYRNDLVGQYLQKNKQQEKDAAASSVAATATATAGTKRLSRADSTIQSSLKGNSKRQRNGEKKKVMFRLNDEIPPVSPDSDLLLPVDAGSDDETNVQYFQLPDKMSLLNMSAEMSDEPEEEMIEDTTELQTSSPPSRPTVEQSGLASSLGSSHSYGSLGVRSLAPEQTLPTTSVSLSTDPISSSYRGGIRRTSQNRQPLKLQPSPVRTPSAEQIRRESTFDDDDVFALDENLDSHGNNNTSSFAEPSFRVQIGSRSTSFTDNFHSAFASSSDAPQSGWVGHSVSLHTPNRSPVTDTFQMDDDLPFDGGSNALSIPVPMGMQSGSPASSYDDNEEDTHDVPTTLSGSAYGSSLPIEIGTPMSSSVRRSSRELVDDSGGEMGLPGGVLGDDEEYKLEKLKSVDNPDRLSFSHRIIWEEHVAGSLRNR